MAFVAGLPVVVDINVPKRSYQLMPAVKLFAADKAAL